MDKFRWRFFGTLLMTCVCVSRSAHAQQRAACPAIEMSAVADARSDSTRPVALNDTTIQLARTPLVTSVDIIGAHPSSSTEGQWVVNVNVTDQAAKRVHDFTADHVGRILAVLLDGKVMSTPKIAGPVTGKNFFIGKFQRVDAERLAAQIGNGCKR